MIINAFALAGRIVLGGFLPQGVALGYVLLPLRGVLLRFFDTRSSYSMLYNIRRMNLIPYLYYSFCLFYLIPLRSNPFKYKQMLILFINPLVLRLYIRKPKE